MYHVGDKKSTFKETLSNTSNMISIMITKTWAKVLKDFIHLCCSVLRSRIKHDGFCGSLTQNHLQVFLIYRLRFIVVDNQPSHFIEPFLFFRPKFIKWMSLLFIYMINPIKWLNCKPLPASCDLLWPAAVVGGGWNVLFCHPPANGHLHLSLSVCKSQNKGGCFVQLASAFYRNQQTYTGPVKNQWPSAKTIPHNNPSMVSAFTYTSAAVSLVHSFSHTSSLCSL